jgi:clan AA aspartic protease (TIGR02281 family)
MEFIRTNKMKKIFLAATFSIFVFLFEARADVLYLKNGRQIEGAIIKADEESVELEVNCGMVKFYKGQIERIDRSNPGELVVLRKSWQKSNDEEKAKKLKAQVEEAIKPKKIKFTQQSGAMFVDAVLNNKFPCNLALDTGASYVVLTKALAEKIGLNTSDKKDVVTMQLADGRKIEAKHVLLESILIGDTEAQNVDAAILLEDVGDNKIKDGLLGMSFLNRFNLKFDYNNSELVLESLEPKK